MRFLKWAGSVIAAVMIGGGVLAYVLKDTPAVATMCGSEWAADHRNVSHPLCKRDFERVTSAEAEEFIDRFLGRISGTQRDADVSQKMMLDSPADALKSDWHTVLYAERISEITRSSNPNQFVTTIRRYRVVPPELVDTDRSFYAAALGLDEISMTSTLVHNDAGVLAKRLDLSDRDPLRTFRQRFALATVLTDNYPQPQRSDSGAKNLGPPDGTYEICQLEYPPGSGTWWAKTYLGWTPHADLQGGEGEVAGTELCKAVKYQ